jgi:hypothetical protein
MRRTIFYPLAALTIFLLISILCSQSVLTRIGDFLAPLSSKKAEAVILEGTATITKGAVKEGIGLLTNSNSRLVVVVHLNKEEGQLFAIQKEYPLLLRRALEALGLKEGRVQIISVPINDDPVTLTEARFVMAALSKEGIRNAVLVSEGFHTRRSWAVYQQEGKPFNLSIEPHPCFVNYTRDHWWRQKEGIRNFVQETSKLIYYLALGYASPRYVFGWGEGSGNME